MADAVDSVVGAERVDELDEVRLVGERERFEGDEGRVDGELSEGEKANEVEDSGREVTARRDARTRARRTRRACRPRLRTFVTVSLLFAVVVVAEDEVAALPFEGAEGVNDFRAARI